MSVARPPALKNGGTYARGSGGGPPFGSLTRATLEDHPRSCFREDGVPKVTWRTRAEAKRAAKRVSRLRGYKSSVYVCPFDLGFHVAHRRSGDVPERATSTTTSYRSTR